MKKNTASQKWIVYAFTPADGLPVTGDAANITANLRLDGGAANAVDDTAPTELEDGYYVFDLTQAETNADSVVICPASSTAGVVVIGVPGAVYPRASVDQTGDAYARLGAPAGASIAADIAGVAAGVWAVGSRTLTSFGSLVADIWASATRTLTAVADSSGVTTLLSRVVGTLAAGTHEPQSGDAFVRLGAPAGASHAADAAAMKAETAAIVEDTGTTLPAAITAAAGAVAIADDGLTAAALAEDSKELLMHMMGFAANRFIICYGWDLGTPPILEVTGHTGLGATVLTLYSLRGEMIYDDDDYRTIGTIDAAGFTPEPGYIQGSEDSVLVIEMTGGNIPAGTRITISPLMAGTGEREPIVLYYPRAVNNSHAPTTVIGEHIFWGFLTNSFSQRPEGATASAVAAIPTDDAATPAAAAQVAAEALKAEWDPGGRLDLLLDAAISAGGAGATLAEIVALGLAKETTLLSQAAKGSLLIQRTTLDEVLVVRGDTAPITWTGLPFDTTGRTVLLTVKKAGKRSSAVAADILVDGLACTVLSSTSVRFTPPAETTFGTVGSYVYDLEARLTADDSDPRSAIGRLRVAQDVRQ